MQYLFSMITPTLLRLLLTLTFISCHTGKLKPIASFPIALKEASAAEVIDGTNVMWTIEDHGNDSDLHAFNASTGERISSFKVDAPNKDWEDLTSDEYGNLYIGDIGNNDHKRKELQIYKVTNPLKSEGTLNVLETITFTLPKDLRKNDFEAFFLWNNHFYLFSKNHKKCVLLKVPNKNGTQKAELLTYFKFEEGKDNRITSADIRNDGRELVLLNHDKLWRITEFKEDRFFEGKLVSFPFGHNSQKEGICYKSFETLLITDERNGNEGGNIYSFSLKSQN